jgi:hypothetical protein
MDTCGDPGHIAAGTAAPAATAPSLAPSQISLETFIEKRIKQLHKDRLDLPNLYAQVHHLQSRLATLQAHFHWHDRLDIDKQIGLLQGRIRTLESDEYVAEFERNVAPYKVAADLERLTCQMQSYIQHNLCHPQENVSAPPVPPSVVAMHSAFGPDPADGNVPMEDIVDLADAASPPTIQEDMVRVTWTWMPPRLPLGPSVPAVATPRSVPTIIATKGPSAYDLLQKTVIPPRVVAPPNPSHSSTKPTGVAPPAQAATAASSSSSKKRSRAAAANEPKMKNLASFFFSSSLQTPVPKQSRVTVESVSSASTTPSRTPQRGTAIEPSLVETVTASPPPPAAAATVVEGSMVRCDEDDDVLVLRIDALPSLPSTMSMDIPLVVYAQPPTHGMLVPGGPLLLTTPLLPKKAPIGSHRKIDSQVFKHFLTEVEHIPTPVQIVDEDTCVNPKCNKHTMVRMTETSMMTCELCGYSKVYLDATATSGSMGSSAYSAAKKDGTLSHFQEFLIHFENLETLTIPTEHLEIIMLCLWESGIRHTQHITVVYIREALKHLKSRYPKFTDYYSKTTQIYCRLTGRAPPRLSPRQREIAKYMVGAYLKAWPMFKPPKRKNNPSLPYLLWKLCQSNHWNELYEFIVLLRGTDKVRNHEEWTRNIYKHLLTTTNDKRWTFVPINEAAYTMNRLQGATGLVPMASGVVPTTASTGTSGLWTSRVFGGGPSGGPSVKLEPMHDTDAAHDNANDDD